MRKSISLSSKFKGFEKLFLVQYGRFSNEGREFLGFVKKTLPSPINRYFGSRNEFESIKYSKFEALVGST